LLTKLDGGIYWLDIVEGDVEDVISNKQKDSLVLQVTVTSKGQERRKMRAQETYSTVEQSNLLIWGEEDSFNCERSGSPYPKVHFTGSLLYSTESSLLSY